MKAKIIDILKQELKWCKENNKKNDVYKNGFIKGVEQSIFLIKAIDKDNQTVNEG